MESSTDPATGGDSVPGQSGTGSVHESSIRLRAELAQWVRAECKSRGFDHGDLVIEALVTTLEDGSLVKRLHPAGIVGGGRFQRRSAGAKSRKPAAASERPATASLSFSAFESDFNEFRSLCKELLVASTTKLLVAALETYHAKCTAKEETEDNEPGDPQAGHENPGFRHSDEIAAVRSLPTTKGASGGRKATARKAEGPARSGRTQPTARAESGGG